MQRNDFQRSVTEGRKAQTSMPDAPSETPPVVLVFAATDPSGGAGLQADLLTLASMGCHPAPVVTALTVQDTRGVEDILPIDAEWVADQARCVLEDMPVAAFKLGVLGGVETIAAIAEVVADYPDVPLILDPVLASGRGDSFVNDEAIAAMRELLLPQTTIITPNSYEARRLVADEREDEELDLATCARRLIAAGCEYALITGTHENTAQVINRLFGERGELRSDAWARLPGSYHGSGCTLASALTAALVNGLSVEDAARDAQEYTWQALEAGFRPGMGQFIPDRLFWARAEARGSDAEGEAVEAAAEATTEDADETPDATPAPGVGARTAGPASAGGDITLSPPLPRVLG